MARLLPENRKAMILKSTVLAIEKHGILTFTDEQVANGCDLETSQATVRRYFFTRKMLLQSLHDSPQCPIKLKRRMIELKICT